MKLTKTEIEEIKTRLRKYVPKHTFEDLRKIFKHIDACFEEDKARVRKEQLKLFPQYNDPEQLRKKYQF